MKTGLQEKTKKLLLLVLKCSANCLTMRKLATHVALLRGVERKDIERGQVLAKPGTITPHTDLKAEVYVLTKEEGGRHKPFFTSYRPQFYFRTTDVTGIIIFQKA